MTDCAWLKSGYYTHDPCGARAIHQLGAVTCGVPLCADHDEAVREWVVREWQQDRRDQQAQRAEDHEARSCIYVIAAEVDGQPLCKVGFSKEPERRARWLGGLLLYTTHGSARNERALHEILATAHVVGEWFKPGPVATHFHLDLPPEPWPQLRRRWS